MKRRTLLCGVVPAVVAAASVGCSVNAPRYRLFNEQESDILGAFADQIIPKDESASASDANVLRYIDRQLVRAYVQHRQTYRKGLACLDESARKLHGQGFADLSARKQESFLLQMEQGELPEAIWGDLSPSTFFRLVRDHVMQGYYGDPRHGGNDGLASWRMLSLPYPPIRGREDYRFPKA